MIIPQRGTRKRVNTKSTIVKLSVVTVTTHFVSGCRMLLLLLIVTALSPTGRHWPFEKVALFICSSQLIKNALDLRSAEIYIFPLRCNPGSRMNKQIRLRLINSNAINFCESSLDAHFDRQTPQNPFETWPMRMIFFFYKKKAEQWLHHINDWLSAFSHS